MCRSYKLEKADVPSENLAVATPESREGENGEEGEGEGEREGGGEGEGEGSEMKEVENEEGESTSQDAEEDVNGEGINHQFYICCCNPANVFLYHRKWSASGSRGGREGE